MARLPRLIIPFQPHYVIARGNNGQPIFQDGADYTVFLEWLRKAAKNFKVTVHAYVLLPDCVHFLVSPSDTTGLGQMMQWLGRYYVPYFNRKYQRSGTLWQGRYKASVVDVEHYLMQCSRYIESLPVRANLAATAFDYPWSSYAQHGGMRQDPLVTDHALYWSLGNTPFEREAAYGALVGQTLAPEEIELIEQAVLKGWPLGSDRYKATLQQRMARQILPAKRGRPVKAAADPP
ncbi:MAG: putative transposase [Janthinobacterium sp.]|jgi:putative transposase